MKNIFYNAHIQTLFATYYNVDSLALEHERFTLSDGDFVDCLWHERALCEGSSKPIVVLFHGLAGSVESPYIKRTMVALDNMGFSVVLMHFRGCYKEPNLLARSYHSGASGDAREFIEYLRAKYSSKIFAVGFSIGGNMLLKLMGESKELLDGAVAISAPMDLEVCANRIEQGFSRFYQSHLLKPLKEQLRYKCSEFDLKGIIGLEYKEIDKISSFWEFDNLYTAPIHGFADAQEYYSLCSAKRFLKDITKPTLIIHSIDDPFTGSGVIPNLDDISGSIELDIRDCGGHLGFIEGSFFKPNFWVFNRVGEFLHTLLKNI